MAPRLRFSGPVLDSSDPRGLARFYEELLGWPIVAQEGPRPGYPPADGWAKVRSREDDLKIEFQWEAAYVPPTWPPAGTEQQMMIHLDFGVDDLDEGIAWATSVGAVEAEFQPQTDVRVMLDPAGHPFCLFVDTA